MDLGEVAGLDLGFGVDLIKVLSENHVVHQHDLLTTEFDLQRVLFLAW